MSQLLLASVIFHIAWGAIIFLEVLNPTYKLAALCGVPIVFWLVHLKLFSKTSIKDLLFIGIAFLMGITAETALTSLSIYYFGLVDLPGLSWPPPWIAALWMVFPIYLVSSVQINKKYRMPATYLMAISVYITYRFLGARLDLIFFNGPHLQSAVFFILVWYLLIRLLYGLYQQIQKTKLF